MSEVSPRAAVTSAVSVSFGEVCDRGKVREENQDNVRSASIPLGELFIVADGIGGYQGGAIASRMVVDGFHSQLAIKPAGYPAEQALQEACTYTNTSIHTAALSGDPSLQRMGSTVVLALIRAEPQPAGGLGSAAPDLEVLIGHVGDSRAYLVRNGKMSRLTSDHSAVQALLNRNLITEEEARNHPDSSVLTRSLGHRPEVDIEIDRVPLEAGDALLLCSDGLWGYVAEADIAAVVTDGTLSVQTVADTLLHQALAAGGHDNIGIEFIRIDGTSPSIAVAPRAGISNSATGRHKVTGHARTQQMIAIALLLLGGCGYLGYALRSHSWPFSQHAHKADLGGKLDSSNGAQSPAPSSGPSSLQVPAPKSSQSPSQGKKQLKGAPEDKTHKPQADKQTSVGRPVSDKPTNDKQILVVGEDESSPEGTGELLPSGTIHWKHIRFTRESIEGCAKYADRKPVVFAHNKKDLDELLTQHPELGKHVNSVAIVTFADKFPSECGEEYDAILILPKKK